MATHAKTGPRDLDQLPKEMHDMKIRDDKVDTGDDKVIHQVSFAYSWLACMSFVLT